MQAETIADWDLDGVPNVEVDTVAPSTLASGLESSGLLRGPGVSPANLTNGYSAVNFTVGGDDPSRSKAISNGEYIGFDLRVVPGHTASFSSVDLSLRRSAFNGPMFYELQYSFDDFATPGTTVVDFTYRGRSSGTNTTTSFDPAEYMRFGAPDSYLDDFDLPPDLAGQSGGVSDPGNPMPTIDLSDFPELQDIPGGTTVTFGLFAWGNASTATTNTVAFGRIDGPHVTGSVVEEDLGGDLAFEIRSAFPSTDPEPGFHPAPAGTEITATASQIVDGDVRNQPIGWTGTGSVTDGEGSSVTFTLNEASLLEWRWETEHKLDVSVAGDGSVLVRLTDRAPLLGFDFDGWTHRDDGPLEGEQHNAEGVPASTVTPEVELSTITRGPGLEPANLSAGGISSSNWINTANLDDAISGDKYLEFNVTAATGESVEVNSIYVPYRYTQTGPHSIALLYSFDNFSTYTVAESMRIQDQNSGTNLDSHLFVLPSDPALRDISDEVLFRIYGWGGTGSGVGTFAIYNENGSDIDDMVIFGGTTSEHTVTGSESFWLRPDSVVEFEATPSSESLFAGWSGLYAHSVPTISGLFMTHPVSLQANFQTDSDGDGIPDWWKLQYFGDLSVDANEDSDGDGFTNLEEYLRGTDPTVAEDLAAIDNVVPSAWENVQRDPQVPGQFLVRDFGNGFRGAWENSFDNRNAMTPFRPDGGSVAAVEAVSYDGPRMIIRDEAWDDTWSEGTVSAVLSVGALNGNSLFFRYQDELNWYRVTISGQGQEPAGPRFGISVDKRVDGQFEFLDSSSSLATDPEDSSSSLAKKVRITVIPQGIGMYDIEVSPWDETLSPAGWGNTTTLNSWDFDDELTWGRAGVGSWAQGDHDHEVPAWNPVDSGVLFESFTVTMDGDTVFHEDWSDAPLADELPAGWSNPYAGESSLVGDWVTTAHGTIAQLSVQGESTSSTETSPKADAAGPVLLGPEAGVSDYLLELGIHTFDQGAVGFVFDYQDTDNYGRVMFAQTFGSVAGSIPNGVVVSRKSDGVWTDLFIGDETFIYTPAQPFEVTFSRTGSRYVLNVRDMDTLEPVHRWEWDDANAPGAAGRYGLTTWQAGNSHFLYTDVYGVAVVDVGDLAVTAIEKVGETIVLTIENDSGEPYQVERTLDLASGEWDTVGTDETGSTWTGDIPAGAERAFWRLTR